MERILISGLDVSAYQLHTPSLVGKDFLFIRAVIGTSPDVLYPRHYANGRKAGVVIGAYAFGVKADGVAQAKALLDIGKDADLLVLDREGVNPMTLAQARAFISTIHKAGRTCGLYASESGFPSVGQDFNWVANWSTEPQIPWTFWQNGPERGIDHDFYDGTREDLNKLAGIEEPMGPIVTHITPAVSIASVDITQETYAIRVNDGIHKPVHKGENYVVTYIGTFGSETVVGIVKDTANFIVGLSAVKSKLYPLPDCSAAIQADRAKAHIVYD